MFYKHSPVFFKEISGMCWWYCFKWKDCMKFTWGRHGRDHMVVGLTTICNQCWSPLTLWLWIHSYRDVFDTTLCDKVCQWLAAGLWFSPGTPVSSTSNTDRFDKTEILLKVAFNTITTTMIFTWKGRNLSKYPCAFLRSEVQCNKTP